MKKEKELQVIYQAENGSLEIELDEKNDTIWASLNQIAMLFDRDKSVVSRHIKNIFETKELERRQAVAFFATTAEDGKTYNVEYFNLDVILSVGYRINSKNATKFRQWATQVLHKHIVNGWTINKDRIKINYNEFLKAVDDLKQLLPNESDVLKNSDMLELIKTFANTWFSLDAYDKDFLPLVGITKEKIEITAKDFEKDLWELKLDLINKGEATDFFARERQIGSLEGVFGNVMQSFDGNDVYGTIEEKAANLFYFLVKNHLFVDGNKRSGAYGFIWFLSKSNKLNINKINSQTLTALTILVAESNPKNKEKMIGLILQLLNK